MVKLRRMRAVFNKVKDPRAGNARHRLFDLIFIALAATLTGATTCLQIAMFAEAKKEMLRELLGLEHGVPSHDTFSRIFRILDSQSFEAAFRDFTRLFAKVVAPDTVVALDGKAVRNATAEGGRFCPLQLVNVWACDAGIALAQVKAPNRNEVAGAREILKLLSIAGAIVTADALHCRPDIAQAILDKDADYVLALKGNRKKILADVKARLRDQTPTSSARQRASRSHGRFEQRCASVLRANDIAELHNFPGVQAIACIQTWRGFKRLPKKPSSRYFLLSSYMPASRLLKVVRDHWGIENNLHGVLDVTFREDSARARLDNAPENLAVLRKIALNMLKSHPAKMPLNHKIYRASLREDFLLSIFQNAANPRQDDA